MHGTNEKITIIDLPLLTDINWENKQMKYTMESSNLTQKPKTEYSRMKSSLSSVMWGIGSTPDGTVAVHYYMLLQGLMKS